MREFPTRAHGSRPRLEDPRRLLTSRARLFSLLALLIPLFGALQVLAADGLPRVDLRTASSETPVVAVERIVERLVYVPVPSVMLHPWPRLTWDLSRWDMSRLPSVDSFHLPLFRPAPTVSAWPASAQAAHAAQVNDAGLTGASFGRAVRLFEDPAIGTVDGSLVLADPITGRLRLPASLMAQPMTPAGLGPGLSPSGTADPLLTNTTGPNVAFVAEPRAGETDSDTLAVGGDGLDTELTAPAPLTGLPLPPAAPISAASAASTPVPATSTPRPGSTATPTAIPATATARAIGSATATLVPPVTTSVPGTATIAMPGTEVVPPTATTEIPATATRVPPTSISQPTATRVPATSTPRPTAEPTNGPADVTDTPVPTRTPSPRTQATQTPTPHTQPTSTPKADPTKTPTPKSGATKAEATETPSPQPAPTKTPTPEPESTKTPTPKAEPTKTPTPKVEPTKTPTPKVEPTKTPTPKAQPTKTPPPHGGGKR